MGYHYHSLKLTRRSIAERGMESFLIIHVLNKVGNPLTDILHGTVLPQGDLLGCKGFYETLGISIFVGGTLPAHDDLKAIGLKLFDILTRGILDTAV